MQKALVIDRSGMTGDMKELNDYLAKGWVVEKMQPFHPSVAVATGSTYSPRELKDRGALLVIIEDLGVKDPE